METWDVKPTLQKFQTMGPLHDLPLKALTLKLVMLMALTQAAWVQALHLLLLRNISMGENYVSLLSWGTYNSATPSLRFGWSSLMLKCQMLGCVPDFEGIYCKN